MQLEKKQIEKEDGRYLVYYHFPESATPEENTVFAAIQDGEVLSQPAADETAKTEETAHV